ncbi:MAG: catalase family protein [Herminiimonas sp.]|nr:catalase family protein [Herminiimonas sp.]
MTQTTPAVPLRFDTAFEHLEDDEAQTIADIVEQMQKISAVTTRDYGHAVRSVHAKSHGLLYGELMVLDNLPSELAQGMFAKTATFPIVMRLSTTPGDILDDRVSTPRGMAIKLSGVEGARLPGSENATTQDFVLVNGPAFLTPDVKSFSKSLKLLASTTDKAEGLKIAFSAVLRGTEKIIESVGGKNATIRGLGGHPETHILGETFFSQAPLLYGQYLCKISVAPVSAELTALTDAPVDLHDKPNGLRDAVIDHFRQHGGEWELRVQLCTNLATMPVEDASVEWPQQESPYRTVARIRVRPQAAWNAAREAAIDGGLSFSPWHGIADHRPLGSVMRARKVVYQVMSAARLKTNGRPAGEPASLEMPAD